MVAATIPHVVLESVARAPHAVAIVNADGSMLNYEGLRRQIFAWAKAFIAAGVVHGDRVAVWAPNSGRWIAAALGLQSVGAALIPLNTRYKGAEAAYILKRSRARILVTMSEFQGNDFPALIAPHTFDDLDRIVLLDGDRGGEPWERFLESGRSIGDDDFERRLAELEPGHVSDIMFTSGTTGAPKGVITTHGQNVEAYGNFGKGLGWRSDDRLLAINPFFHSFGYKAGWLVAFMNGASVYPVTVFDAETALQQIERDRITVVPGPPTIYQSMLARPLDGRDLSSLRLANTGATTVPESLVYAMREELRIDHVVTAYGLTETCGVVSVCRLSDEVPLIAATSGRPIPGVEIEIRDKDGNRLAAHEQGHIMVRGPNVMAGYLDDREATDAAIDAEGWLDTGDIGLLTGEGYIRITDRSKDVVIVGGFNVYPAEVERMLLEHPDIVDVAVVGMKDERLGEVCQAFVVARERAVPDTEAMMCWARDNMANYKVPRRFRYLQALPRNASGKIEKYRLTAEFSG